MSDRPRLQSPADAATGAGPRSGCDRWRRPLNGRRERLLAWVSMLFADHGLLRLAHLNRHRIADGVWRAGQPAPHQIRAFASAGGRSVVSLRAGQNFGSLPLEVEACRAAGLSFHNLIIRSRGLPSREEFRAIAAFFRSVERPVLLHCKSGSDRAGFAAALWLVLAEGRSPAEARRQLGLRYGHVRLSRTGVLDAFFDAFERDTAGNPMPLTEWVETSYDPARLTTEFRATPLAARLGVMLRRG